jgi:hypothetical protein
MGNEGKVVDDHGIGIASAVAAPGIDLDALCWLRQPTPWVTQQRCQAKAPCFGAGDTWGCRIPLGAPL